MGVSINGGSRNWFIMDNPIKMDDFRKPHVYSRGPKQNTCLFDQGLCCLWPFGAFTCLQASSVLDKWMGPRSESSSLSWKKFEVELVVRITIEQYSRNISDILRPSMT